MQAVQPHWLATGTAEVKASTRGAVRILMVLTEARKLVGMVGCRLDGLKAVRLAGTDTTTSRPDGLKIAPPAGTNTTRRTVCAQKTTIIKTDLFVR